MKANAATALPSVEDIDAIPDELLVQAALQLTALLARLAIRQQEAAQRRPAFITVEEAADQAHVSTHYLYERARSDHPDRLPFLRRRGRAVRVEVGGFTRWLTRRP